MSSQRPTLARAERAALCDLLDEVGPDAPTLCEGWASHDLAAHLVVRERRPDSGPGLVLKALAGWTERVRLQARSKPYTTLVSLVRSGPPRLSPFSLPGVDAAANSAEYLIHHEDVRRARQGWEPRVFDDDVQKLLWKRFGSGAGRLPFRSVPVGVVLRDLGGATVEVRKGSPVVTIVGLPSEILLYSSGRREHARVELEGEADAVEQLRQAHLGV
jgi:uncharacterized protein (TIGR03085 family)